MKEEPGSIFSRAHAADMLLYVATHVKVKENELTAVCKNYYTALKVVTFLLDLNLVSKSIDERGRTTTYYELTPLGLDVAADLKRANDRILGIPPESSTNCGTSEEKMDPVTDE